MQTAIRFAAFISKSNYLSLRVGKRLTVCPPYTLPDWYFDDQGIYIHFAIPFAAGSNAALFIPYGELKDLLDPDGPIGVLAAGAG